MNSNPGEIAKTATDPFFSPTLQLILKGVNVPTPSYFKLYLNSSASGSNWILQCATEVNMTDPHPTFKDLKFQYNFASEQVISIELWSASFEANKLVGTAKFNFAHLLRAPMKFLELPFELSPKFQVNVTPSLKISIDEPVEFKDILSLTFGAKFTKKSMFTPKMHFSLWKKVDANDYVKVLQSQQVSSRNPVWPQIKVKVSNQFKQFGVLRVVVHESSDRILGHSEFGYPDLVELHKKSFMLVKFEGKKNNVAEAVDQGSIELVEYHLEKAMTFNEYYTAGLELQYYPIIDFSPFGKSKEGGEADATAIENYKQTVGFVSNIIEKYLGDKHMTAFGIGANHSVETNRHFFPLSEEKKINITDYKSLLNAFDNALKNLEERMNTVKLMPVIKEVLRNLKQDMMVSHKIKYYVCTIFIAGEVEDLRDVIDQVIICSYGVPVSFLILEMGEKASAQLQHLHNGEEHLKDSQSRYLHRLNVKFVNLAEHQNTASAVQKLLEDVSRHMFTLLNKLEILPHNFSSSDALEKYLKLSNLITSDVAEAEGSSFSTSPSSNKSFSKSSAMSVFD